ncbi:MAG: EVE domain-containing protein [Pirellulaceae bacterium]
MVYGRFEAGGEVSEELSLPALRQVPALAGMALRKRGSRPSVQPVSPQEFKTVLALAEIDES